MLNLRRFSNIRPILQNRATLFKFNGRCNKFSSLGNPMFPDRPQPDLFELDAAAKANKKGKKDESTSTTVDFLSNHGGKVFGVSVVIIIGLMYTYYQGGQNRTKVEDEATNQIIVEPYELQDLRNSNELTIDEYKNILNLCLKSSHSNSLTYYEFIYLVQNELKKKGKSISCGFLLDRMVYKNILKHFKNEEKIDLFGEISLPVPYLLTLLNLTMSSGSGLLSEIGVHEAVFNRIEGLFYVASKIPNDKNQFGTQNHSENENNNEKISKEQLLEILRQLLITDQIPSEKQVAEDEMKYRIKQYRRKTPQDMVDNYILASKGKEQLDEVDLEQFSKLLKSVHVCIWGECYRNNKY